MASYGGSSSYLPVWELELMINNSDYQVVRVPLFSGGGQEIKVGKR